ncbi:MAG: energy-coupling factor transporter transmembrane protein EcfT [Clostridiales bacterium]|nr:energy-coupling factor transporter transmembrane protein EcfT [Clostridiales bacterium]
MNFNITIGQYYPTDSILHRLDPRVKLAASLSFIIIVCLIDNGFGYAISAAFIAAAVWASNVPVKLMLRGMKSIFFFIVFTFTVNIFLIPGGNILFNLGPVKISAEALNTALLMTARLSIMIFASSLLTLTSSPIQLTDAIEYYLAPFKKIGVPSHQIAMMMTITLRFIPTLIDELDKIVRAQKARGADLDTGGAFKKAKALIPILVPLFLSSFRRADELATAMEARCYRGDIERTKMKQMKFGMQDLYAGIIFICICSCIIMANFIF